MNQPPHIVYGNRWVLAHDSSCHLTTLRDEHKASGEHVIGYPYVDHTAGLSMHVSSFCKVDFSEQITVTGDLEVIKVRAIIRYDVLSRWDITPLTDEQIKALGLPETPDFLQFYENKEVEPLRQLDFLHPLRAPGYPDDVKFAMEGPEGVEVVWGRLERRVSDNRFECTLLNQPSQNTGVNAGSRVIVLIEPSPQGIRSQFVGTADQ